MQSHYCDEFPKCQVIRKNEKTYNKTTLTSRSASVKSATLLFFFLDFFSPKQTSMISLFTKAHNYNFTYCQIAFLVRRLSTVNYVPDQMILMKLWTQNRTDFLPTELLHVGEARVCRIPFTYTVRRSVPERVFLSRRKCFCFELFDVLIFKNQFFYLHLIKSWNLSSISTLIHVKINSIRTSMAAFHNEDVNRMIQQDWANREYIEIITGSIKKIADFLNSFGMI